MKSVYKKNRKGGKYDLWDKRSGIDVKHNDRDVDSGLYYNEYLDRWGKYISKKVMKKKSEVELYDFRVFSLDDIKNLYGKGKVERIGMFLSLIYDRSFVEGYNRDNWNGVYFSSDELKRIIGKDCIKIINKLVNRGVVDFNKKNSKHRVYRSLRYFKLGEVFEDVLKVEFERVEIKDARFEKSLREYFNRNSENREGVLKKVEMTLDRCDLVIKKMGPVIDELYRGRLEKDLIDLESDFVSKKDKNAILDKLKDMDAYERKYKENIQGLYDLLLCIINKNIEEEKRCLYRISKDRFGKRLYHLFSNVPREFRRQIKIDGENVVEIDITASQPSFLCLLFVKGVQDDSIKEILEMYKNDKFVQIAKEYKMDIYKYMAVQIKGEEFRNDPVVRVNMKKVFFQLVFGDPLAKYGYKKKMALCDKLFGADFFPFLCKLSELDLGKDLSDSYKNLSFLLQTLESKFLNCVMDEIGDMPFLPMHDSLVVKKSDAKKVKNLFKKAIIDNKLEGIISFS
jgi:hypothetical protein